MAFYEFKREDNGEIVEASFPIGKCPQQIICDDGVTARKIISASNIVIHGSSSPSKADQKKMRQETLNIANEIGMKNFVPLKGQTPEQQLKDIKQNKSEFAERMAEKQELTLRIQRDKMKDMAEKNKATNKTVEKYLQRREKQAEAQQKKNKIII